MSLRRIEIPEPPPPPPPKRCEEVLVCDGCEVEGYRARPMECVALPVGWVQVRRTGGAGATYDPSVRRFDLCPECADGAIIVLAGEQQLHLRDVQ